MIRLLIIISFIFGTILPVRADGGEYTKEEQEYRIGHLMDYYMTESFVKLKDEELSSRIAEVVDRILKVTEKSASKFLLRIINDQLPVAVSFPGYIYISSGMLDILDSEGELAFVISHAIAHAIEGDLHQTYADAVKKDRIANFTGHIMPLLVFTGVGAAAVASGGLVAASASGFGYATYIGSGVSSAATLAQGLTTTDMREKKIIHNRLIPHIDLPDKKAGFSVLVYLGDVYKGYGEEDEIQADNLAISYLGKAGYDPDAILSVLYKLMRLNKGHLFHLLLAEPGLEKRIDNAHRTLENYK